MNARGTMLIVFLVATAAGVGLIVALSHSRETLRSLDGEKQSLIARMQALATEHSRLRNEIAELSANEAPQSAAQPSRLQELQTTLAQIIAARKDNPPPPSTHQPYPRSTKGDIFPELLADPEYLRHYMTYESLNLEQRYADFYATTSARREAVEKLKHALVHRSISELEREELIAKHGVPAGERGELSHLLAQKFDAEVREILGETGHAEFKRFEQTLVQRTAVTAFAERLSYADRPLSKTQATELIEIMTSTTVPYGNRQIPVSKFTEAVIDRAKAVLSTPQLEEMKRFQQELDAARRQ